MTDIAGDESPNPLFDARRMPERNLERALLDFELANVRVLDLTQRMISLNDDLVSTRAQLEDCRLHSSRLEAEANRLRSELDQIKGSLTYRGFRLLADTRIRLRR